MPRITPPMIAQALYESAQDASPDAMPALLENTAKLMQRYGMGDAYDTVMMHFERLHNDERNIIAAQTISRHALNDELRQSVQDALGKRFPGKTIQLTETINPKLAGGMRVMVGDLLLDYSLDAKIDQLRKHLLEPISQ